MLTKKITDMFSSVEGRSLFDRINRYSSENNMHDRFNDGVLVGFSGGPDSVMLLCFLHELSKRSTGFKILACHINHMIRGVDADADEMNAKRFSRELGIEFYAERVDVPALSRELSLGTEECARNIRYSVFSKIICGRNDVKYVATAHNLGDNIETALFNILRGAGPLGASGISPIRDNVLRPMLSVSKRDILSLLDRFEIPYSIDKTNLASDYTRNFIRNEICTKISEKFPTYEQTISRFTENMRDCYEFISSETLEFLSKRDMIKNDELSRLNNAVFQEVICNMSGLRVSREMTLKIKELLLEDNFSYSLPFGKVFLCERGVCSVVDCRDIEEKKFNYPLTMGLNTFSDFSSAIYLSWEPLPNSYLNIYKISIQDRIPFDIIYGEMYIRSREAGDTIYYNGMTHKIKKMFCDRKIPNSKKNLIPIFCDEKGPILVPGYHARGDSSQTEKYLYVYILDNVNDLENRFLTGKDFS